MAQNLLDSDSFGGTNGDSLSTYNAKWSAGSSSSNEAAIRSTPGVGAAGSFSTEKNTGQTWTNDQWAELKVDGTTVADNVFAVYVRLTGDGVTAGNGYGAGKDAGDFGNDTRIWKYVNNTVTTLATDAHVLATNDVLNLEVVGAQLTLRLNGSILLTISDATFSTGGNPGLQLGHSDTSRLGGTWKAGSVGGGNTAHMLGLLGVGN